MSSSLEDFVTSVRNFSSQGQLSKLCDFMNKSWNFLSKNASNLDVVMETLDIQEHSLGMLYVLCVKVSLFQLTNSAEDFDLLMTQCDLFISQCKKEHIQYSIGNFTHMCHFFCDQLCRRGIAIRGIRMISSAIKKIQDHPSQLTSIHADLCQLCLNAKCLEPALKFLDIEVTEISKENRRFDVRNFLSYYYYGGMIYLALKYYKRAVFFFEQVLVCPATAISHIMVEAYKKHILVSIIAEGRISPMPKYASHIITRGIKPLCNPYNELAIAYSSHLFSKLESTIDWNGQSFIQDSNCGLVRQVSASLHKRNIQMLTKTFITMSLSDVAMRVRLTDPQEAERYLRSMIHDGEIFAVINQKDGMVSFFDNPEKYVNATVLKKVDYHINLFMELDHKIRDMESEIIVNPHYVRRTKLKSHGDDDDVDNGLRSSTTSFAI